MSDIGKCQNQKTHESESAGFLVWAKMTNSCEKFCLKWNDFQQNIVASYKDLRKHFDFSDVTLVCEEDNQIEAHRIILTTSSPFFKAVLRKNMHSHPMIYTRGPQGQGPGGHSGFYLPWRGQHLPRGSRWIPCFG